MRWITVVLFLLCVLVIPLSAINDTLTTDPNTPKAAEQEQAVRETDERLAQKVTYDSGEKRLYQVADDITKMTGVTVYCGSSTKDWQVRDIPVAISVNDMPLGTMLYTLAECAHVRLTSATLKGVRYYRLSRSEAVTKEIEDVYEAEKRRSNTEEEWAWDVMTALGKAPDSAVKDVDRDTVVLSRILASLDSSAKETVMNGDTVEVPVNGFAQAPLLRELYDLMWNQIEQLLLDSGKSYTAPGPESKDKSKLVIKRRGNSIMGFSEIYVNMEPMVWGDPEEVAELLVGQMGVPINGYHTNNAFNAKGLQLPLPPQPYSDSNSSEAPNAEAPSGQFVSITKSTSAILGEKLSLEAPKGDKDPHYSDLIMAVAQKSGYSIICEDFLSHKNHPMIEHFKSDITLRDMLANEMHGRFPDGSTPTWFINDRDRVVIGWANRWKECHKNLVPEEMLMRVKEKLDGDGLQLEDYLPLFTLTQQQYGEWIRVSDFTSLLLSNHLTGAHTPFWTMYASLSAEDKARATGSEGLSFGKFDRNHLVSFFRATQQYISNSVFAMTSEAKKARSERLEALNVVVDPDICPTLVMRVKKESVSEFKIVTMNDGRPTIETMKLPGGQQRTRYFIELEGTKDGEKFQTRIDGFDLAFPVYSIKREAELTKNSAKQPAS